MKKVRCAIIIIILASCNDFLELPNDGRVSLDDIFADPHLTGGYVTSCYSYIPSFYGISDFGMTYGGTFLASYTDEAQDVLDILPSAVRNWYIGNTSASSFPLPQVWGHYFQGIRTCNVFLNRINKSTAPFSENQRQEWIAQVYTLRAFYYLQLIKRYGGIPIITEEHDENFDFSDSKRNSFGECAKQIFNDCDSALIRPVNIFGYGQRNSSDYGRMTPAIAHAIKSQTALYATSPLWHDGTVSYEEAALITKTALDYCLSPEAGYKLFTIMPVSGLYSNAYEYYFLLAPDYERSRDNETLLNSYHGAMNQLTVWRNSGLPITEGSYKAGACPSQELVDCYEMRNGISPFVMDKFGVLVKDANGEPMINPDPANTYDPQRPYDGRDPRFRATIYFNGSTKLGGEKIMTQTGGNCEISSSDLKFTRTGYYLRKFNDGRSNINNNLDGRMRIFRLAELYLNFAEAANRYTHDPQKPITSKIVGSTPMSASEALNEIRRRVGMPDLSGKSLTDYLEFEKKCCNERRIELAFEQHRFFDVRRWKILEKTDQEISGMRISNLVDQEAIDLHIPGINRYYNMTSAAGNPYYPVVSQVFTATCPFEGVAVFCSSSGLANASVNLSLYQWDISNQKVSGGILASKFHENFSDNTALEVSAKPGTKFSPGNYIWILDQPKGNVKVAYTEGNVTGIVNYRNEQEINDVSFRSWCIIKFEQYQYERINVSNRAAWVSKYLKYPIPQDDINKIIKTGQQNWQNEGW